jgi:hypothetical protein
VTEAGLKASVTPGGCPVPLNATVCGVPVAVVEIVVVPAEPWETLRLEGLAPIVKSGGGGGPLPARLTSSTSA